MKPKNIERRARYAPRVFSPIGREKNDCAVRALALAAKLSYQDAYDLVQAHGRRRDEPTFHCSRLYDNLFPGRRIEAIGGILDIPTVGQFLKAYPMGRYVCLIKGHAFAVRDGAVYDTLWIALKTHVWYVWDTTED